jgi:tetratricopeptide (TPR) repeat protein
MKQLAITTWVFCFAFFSSCKQSLKCDKLSSYSSILDDMKAKSDTLQLVDDLKLLIKNEPGCIRAYHLIGLLEIKTGNFNNAKTIFLRSLQFAPTSIYSLYNLATLYNLDKDNVSALKYIEAALKSKLADGAAIDYNNLFADEFDIEFSEILFMRGVICFDLGEYENAKKDFLISEKRKYSLSETYSYIANSYYYLNNTDSSCYYLKKWEATTSKLDEPFINKDILSVCNSRK